MSLLDEADGANITCNDLICMMLQIGISDSNLQRELGSIRNPTLDAFTEKIEGYEQAKLAMATNAHGLVASRPNSGGGRRSNVSSGKSAAKPQAGKNRSERERRIALRGKCFRCARADHMLPQCTYPDSVKCNLCGATGHVTPACGRRQTAQVVQPQQLMSSNSHASVPSSQIPHHQLAINYDGDSQVSQDVSPSHWPLPSSASSISSNSRAGAFYSPANMPTPEMPL